MILIIRIVYNESLKTKISEQKPFEFFAGIRYLKQVLLTSLDIYRNKTDENINLNVNVQDSIITKDFSKIIKAMFIYFNDAYHPKSLLRECIELTEIVK